MNNNKTSSVSIIGCGWLGKPLAKSLCEKSYQVVATSQNTDNFTDIEATGATAKQLVLPMAGDVKVEQVANIFGQHSIIICLPPQIKHGKTDYAEKIKQLVVFAEKAGAKKIILISSTAVYGGLSGHVDEKCPLDFSAPKVELLAAAEQAALSFSGKATVLRLAGLIGPKRHPGRFLKMNKKLANSDVAVNLIHLDDVIGLLHHLLVDDAPVGIFNGVNNSHVSKKAFYQQAAQALSLPLPTFTEPSENTMSKIVCGEKAKSQLNYQMQHDDLLSWVTSGKM